MQTSWRTFQNVYCLLIGAAPSHCLPWLFGTSLSFQWRSHQVRNKTFSGLHSLNTQLSSHLLQPCSMANDDIPNLQITCLHNWSFSWPSESWRPPTLLKLSHISLLWVKKKWKWQRCRRISVGSKDRRDLVSDSARCDWRMDQCPLLSFEPVLQLLLPASWCSHPPHHHVGSHKGWIEQHAS